MNQGSDSGQETREGWGRAEGIFIRLPGDELRRPGLDQLRKALLARPWTLLGTVVVVLILGVLVLLFSRPVYQVTAVTLPVSDESGRSGISSLMGQFGGLASLAGVSLGDVGGTRAEAVARLKSANLAIRFIEQRDLLPLLFPDRWDTASAAWMLDDDETPPTLLDGARLFLEDILQVTEEGGELVKVSVRWKDPQQAAEWANGYLALLNDVMRAEQVSQARRSISFLETELNKTSVMDVKQTIYRLLETHINTIVVANARDEFALKVVDAALPPTPGQQVWPRPIPVLGVSVLLGIILGTMLVLGLYFRDEARQSPAG